MYIMLRYCDICHICHIGHEKQRYHVRDGKYVYIAWYKPAREKICNIHRMNSLSFIYTCHIYFSTLPPSPDLARYAPWPGYSYADCNSKIVLGVRQKKMATTDMQLAGTCSLNNCAIGSNSSIRSVIL